MAKTSIGTLKLSPLKENGKFVFVNDAVHINGKVFKGDYVKIFVETYKQSNGRHEITGQHSAVLMVKGIEYHHQTPDIHKTIEDYYNHLTEVYKNHFYFGKK